MSRVLLTAVMLILLLTGCSSGDDGSFQTSSVLEMTDSTALYDVWLTVRVSPLQAKGSLPLIIKTESPDGKFAARDTFEVPLDREWIDAHGNGEVRCCMSALSYDVECLYRRGVSPVVCGEWNVTIKSNGHSVSGLWMRAVKE